MRQLDPASDQLGLVAFHHAGSCGIGEGDPVGGIDADDAIGDGIQDDSLLPVQLANAHFLTCARHELPHRAANGFDGGHQVGVLPHELTGEALHHGNHLIADPDGNGPSRDEAIEPRGGSAQKGRTLAHIGDPARLAERPNQPRKPLSARENRRLGLVIKVLAGTPFGGPGNARADGTLRFIDVPQGGELAGESSAKSLQYAGEPFVHRGGFADDLADHQLDPQAALAPVLLCDVPENAADRNRLGLLAAAAQAGFHFDVFAAGVLQAQRMMLYAHAVQRLVKQRGCFRLYLGRKRRLESDKRFELRRVHAEEALPRGIHVEIAAARTERGDHLRGIIEEVAVAFFAFAQRVFGAACGAQVDGD